MTVERLEYQPSLSQPRLCSATGALVTWNSCVSLLCPAPLFPPRNRPSDQPTAQHTPFQLRSHSYVSHVVSSTLWAGVSFSLFPSRAPPFSPPREETLRVREGWGGEFWCVFCLLRLLALPLRPLSHLCHCCLPFFVFLTSSLQDLPWPWSAGRARPLSATPDLRVAKEREECEQLAGLQAIVPGGRQVL